MNVKTLKSKFHSELSGVHPHEELSAIFYLLLEANNNLTRMQSSAENVPISNQDLWFRQIAQLKQHVPVQYILSRADFYGMQLFVDKNVLIPRPETEELVHMILKDADKNAPLKIIDIGTGSGCIALALKKHLPNAQVYGLDVSKRALQVASRNAAELNLEINWICQSIVDFKTDLNFDIVVSNPPYIPENDKTDMAKNVLAYEPHLALFAPKNNALFFYEKIGEFAQKQLTKNAGKLYFEAHYLWSENVAKLFENSQPTELIKDMFGKNRFVTVKF